MDKIEVFGQIPQARFGHTITFISKGKAILFGGATGDTGKYSIGGDTYSFDIITKYWKKVETTGNAPSPRAAHSAVAVEVNQIVIYGGATGGGSLASDDLFLLDMRGADDSGIFTVVPVVGSTPGRRYGHTLTYTKPFLIVFGGNTGQEPVNDCWCLNVEKSPFSWVKIDCQKGDIPGVRVYHSASLCSQGSANGMVVIFGGRSNDQAALNDAYGLRRHRDGRWDWVRAPSKLEKDSPTGRYQHSSLFVGTLMIILGGRTNNVGEQLMMEVYDTETSEWCRFQSVQRFRHASWILENNIFVYGGFELESPNIPTETITRLNLQKIMFSDEKILQKLSQFIKTQEIPQIASLQQGQFSPNISTMDNSPTSSISNKSNNLQQQNNNNNNNNKVNKNFSPNNVQKHIALNPKNNQEKQFKFIQGQVVDENNNKFDNLKQNDNTIQNKKQNIKGNQFNIAQDASSIHNLMLDSLLQPKSYINVPDNIPFKFKPDHIIALCDLAEAIMREQPMVLRVRAPLKVFGDIHGQYSDLMRFFDLWGAPYENGKDGDIESFDYLFLGDFVDRGNHSLETICLLLALKVRYPDQVHLIRGNHEDKWINNGFGFSEECAQRLGEDPNEEDSVFNRVNRLFEWLPLATIIDDKIICLHGGIGQSLHYVAEIENLQRPLEVIHEVSNAEQQLVVDILWSDPTDSDAELGIQPNVIRDPVGTGNIVKFGPDRVQEFLNKNNLSLIIRAHECVMDGFERFAGGSLITVFSATDYCGRHKNAGAVLIIRKNFEIIPKLIYPSNGGGNWIEDEETLRKRPPTPPRWKNTNQRKSGFE